MPISPSNSPASAALLRPENWSSMDNEKKWEWLIDNQKTDAANASQVISDDELEELADFYVFEKRLGAFFLVTVNHGSLTYSCISI
jgi:hypothetical protein